MAVPKIAFEKHTKIKRPAHRRSNIDSSSTIHSVDSLVIESCYDSKDELTKKRTIDSTSSTDESARKSKKSRRSMAASKVALLDHRRSNSATTFVYYSSFE